MWIINVLLPVLLITAAVAVILFLASNAVALALIRKKMFGYHFTHDPDIPTYTPDGVGVYKTPIEVELEGQMIRGGIYSPKKGGSDPDTLIIVCHGMWGSHLSYMQEVGYFCSSGFDVIGFDYIGTASSDGDDLGGFGQSLRCLNRIIEYVKATDGLSHRKIWVYGHSWGGYAVSNVAKFHPDIAGIVAMAPAASFQAVTKNMFPKFSHFLIPVMVTLDRKAMGEFSGLSAAESLEGYNGKALFIHSEDDPMCPYATTTGEIKEKFGNKFDYLILKDKGHNPQYTHEGLALMREYNRKASELKEEEDKIKLKRETDFLAMGKLDDGVMNAVVSYIKNAA